MDTKQYLVGAIVGVNLISAGLIATVVARSDTPDVRVARIESSPVLLAPVVLRPDPPQPQPPPEPVAVIAKPQDRQACSNICPNACLTKALKPYRPWGL